MSTKPWFHVKQVRRHIFALAEFHHWEKVVSYLYVGKQKAILFDTGMGYSDIDEIVKRITRLPVDVFLTHAHWDHIGGVEHYRNVWIYNDSFEKKFLARGFSSARIPELITSKYFKKPFVPRTYIAKGNHSFHTISDGELLWYEPYHITVIHTPGHTPGSVCYFLEEANVLIAGDTLYPGPLYAQLSESDPWAYAKSIERLLASVDARTMICPGHNAISSTSDLLKSAHVGFSKFLAGRKKAKNINRETVEYKCAGCSILVGRGAARKVRRSLL